MLTLDGALSLLLPLLGADLRWGFPNPQAQSRAARFGIQPAGHRPSNRGQAIIPWASVPWAGSVHSHCAPCRMGAAWGQDGMNEELGAVLPAWCLPLLSSSLCLSQRLCLCAHDHSSGWHWASEAPPQPASSSRCSEPWWGFSRQWVDSRGLLYGSAELRSDQLRGQWVIVLSAGADTWPGVAFWFHLWCLMTQLLGFLWCQKVSLSRPTTTPPPPTPCLLRCCQFSPQTK